MIYRIRKWFYMTKIKEHERWNIRLKASAQIEKILAKQNAELFANIVEEHFLKTGKL